MPDFVKEEDWNELLEYLEDNDENFYNKSLVTIKENDSVTDYVLVGLWTEINFCIAEGTGLKNKIPKAFKVNNSNEIKEIEIEDILLIDYDEKKIFVYWTYDVDDRSVKEIENIWNGWIAKRQTQGVSFNFDYTLREHNYQKLDDDEFKNYLEKWKLLEFKE